MLPESTEVDRFGRSVYGNVSTAYREGGCGASYRDDCQKLRRWEELNSSRGRSRPPAMVKSTLYLEAAVSMRGICGLVAELFYRRNKIQSVRKLNGQQLP
jgi:hypothetical protein